MCLFKSVIVHVCICMCVCVCIYLLCSGGRLQQTLLFPQAAGHDAGDLHGLLQILALQVLFDAPQVVLVQDIVLLQEAAVLLIDLPQQVMKHKRGVRLLVGRIRPVTDRNKQPHVMGEAFDNQTCLYLQQNQSFVKDFCLCLNAKKQLTCKNWQIVCIFKVLALMCRDASLQFAVISYMISVFCCYSSQIPNC